MSQNKNIIHVAMVADDNFAKHLAVAVCSILKNISNESSINFYILSDCLSAENRTRVEQLKLIRECRIIFITVNLKGIGKLTNFSSPYITRISSARLLLPSILSDIDKCLYLDCDVLVQNDISQLWKIDIKDKYFGGVEDPICWDRKINLNIPNKYTYINAGVMIFNLKKMREEYAESAIFNFIDKNYQNLGLGEQDTLNALFYDQCFILPLTWNMMTSVYICDVVFNEYDYAEIRDAWRNPSICHFTYEKKPDSLLSMHPFSREYLKYLKFTAWKNDSLLDVTIRAFFLRIYYLVVSYFFYFKRMMKKNAPAIFKILKGVRLFIKNILNFRIRSKEN